MKKLFISMQILGKEDEEILHEKQKAIRRVKSLIKDKVQVTDSLLTADIAYFAIGWNKTIVGKIEHEICVHYGIPTIEASIVGEE